MLSRYANYRLGSGGEIGSKAKGESTQWLSVGGGDLLTSERCQLRGGGSWG